MAQWESICCIYVRTRVLVHRVHGNAKQKWWISCNPSVWKAEIGILTARQLALLAKLKNSQLPVQIREFASIYKVESDQERHLT